jgi:hypothetical protein
VTTLATLQQLRTFEFDNHPLNLEEGQIALNLSSGNFDSGARDYNIYMYVGNGSNQRLDEGGTELVQGGDPGKGWIRFRLRNVSVQGDEVHGDLSVINSKLSVEKRGSSGSAELLIPTELDSPVTGARPASLRWNTARSILQAWDGNKWDTTSKVFISAIAPANPSNGDLWLDPSGSVILYVFVVPTSGPAAWIPASSGSAATALQPGNGVSPNLQNQIETINSGSF